MEERGNPAGLRQALQETRRERGRATPRGRCSHVYGSPKPPLYIGERERGGALGFPLGGRRPGQMGSPLWVTWPPSQEVGTLDGAPQTPGHMGIGEGGAQPLSGLVCPLPLVHEAPPPTLVGATESPFGHADHHPVPPEHFWTPKPFVQYINLHPRTIPGLVVTSEISSGTPNKIR